MRRMVFIGGAGNKMSPVAGRIIMAIFALLGLLVFVLMAAFAAVAAVVAIPVAALIFLPRLFSKKKEVREPGTGNREQFSGNSEIIDITETENEDRKKLNRGKE